MKTLSSFAILLFMVTSRTAAADPVATYPVVFDGYSLGSGIVVDDQILISTSTFDALIDATVFGEFGCPVGTDTEFGPKFEMPALDALCEFGCPVGTDTEFGPKFEMPAFGWLSLEDAALVLGASVVLHDDGKLELTLDKDDEPSLTSR